MDYKEKYNAALQRARKIYHETEFDNLIFNSVKYNMII